LSLKADIKGIIGPRALFTRLQWPAETKDLGNELDGCTPVTPTQTHLHTHVH